MVYGHLTIVCVVRYKGGCENFAQGPVDLLNINHACLSVAKKYQLV